MSVVGLDLGTSGVRAVAFDDDGRMLAGESRALTLMRDGHGRVELDADAILDAAEQVVKRVAEQVQDAGDPVRALAFSVLGEAVVPVDAAGVPLAPVAVSMDTRGMPCAERFGAEFGAEEFRGITGQPLNGMFSVFKIMAGDERWQTAAGFRCMGDFVAQRWTGRAAIDYGQASRMGLFDVSGGYRWSPEILAAVQSSAPWLTEATLPEALPAGAVIGPVTTDIAERLGLDADVAVVAGSHDQAAAYLGAGGRPSAASVIAFGSSDCFTVGSASRPSGLDGTGIATYPIDETLWITLAGTAAGGWALEWFAGLHDRSVADVFGELAPHPPALLMLPYLAGSGTLDNDPGAHGVIHGLTLETTTAELARAVVEAAGFEFAKIAAAFAERGIEVGDVRVTGAGAENAPALAARAAASALTLTAITRDASARGAALLALRALGGDEERFAAGLERGDSARPPAEHVAWYDAQRAAYRALYDATRTLDNHFSHAPHPQLKENPS